MVRDKGDMIIAEAFYRKVSSVINDEVVIIPEPEPIYAETIKQIMSVRLASEILQKSARWN